MVLGDILLIIFYSFYDMLTIFLFRNTITVWGGSVFDIEFYALPDGRRPVEEFLDSLPTKMRIKAIDSLDLLERYGNQLRMPYSKALNDGLFELRIKFSSDISRIFYFFYVGNKIVVTNGFVKKTQKTPQAQLVKAQKYKKDYERRHNHEWSSEV